MKKIILFYQFHPIPMFFQNFCARYSHVHDPSHCFTGGLFSDPSNLWWAMHRLSYAGVIGLRKAELHAMTVWTILESDRDLYWDSKQGFIGIPSPRDSKKGFLGIPERDC